jgi:GTP-binding protein Era
MELNKHAWTAADEAQVGLVVIDAAANLGIAEERLVNRAVQLSHQQAKRGKAFTLALVLNKMDLVKPRSDVIDLVDRLHEFHEWDEVFYTSALDNDQIDDLREWLLYKAVPGDWEFAPHASSDLTDYQRVEEMVREKCFLRLNQEVPYLITQSNEGWTEHKDGSLTIAQKLVVQTTHQRAMLVGKQGEVIGYIAEQAAKDLVAILNRKVNIRLRVVVDE